MPPAFLRWYEEMAVTRLDLTVRYFQDSTPAGVACREEHFCRREVSLPLPVAQTVLVLVDIWNTHFIESWRERAEQVTAAAIVPVLAAARQAGLTIVHAPSVRVAERYPQAQCYQSPSAPAPAPPEWPPPAFRSRTGPYAVYRNPREQAPGRPLHWADRLELSPHIEVQDDEAVVATGAQLHALLQDRRILHLLYVGFATNWCVLGKDYGIRVMQDRGYNTILLRDATMGVEFPDTLDTLQATELAVREVEQQHGFSTSNRDFLAACRAASECRL